MIVLVALSAAGCSADPPPPPAAQPSTITAIPSPTGEYPDIKVGDHCSFAGDQTYGHDGVSLTCTDQMRWAPMPSDPVEETPDPCTAAREAAQRGQGALLDMLIDNEVAVADLKGCPQYHAAARRAERGFDDGTWTVPQEVKPGTYETTAHLSGRKVGDCYWERRDASKTVANDFVVGARKVRVTIRASDDSLTSEGCGNWVPVA